MEGTPSQAARTLHLHPRGPGAPRWEGLRPGGRGLLSLPAGRGGGGGRRPRLGGRGAEERVGQDGPSAALVPDLRTSSAPPRDRSLTRALRPRSPAAPLSTAHREVSCGCLQTETAALPNQSSLGLPPGPAASSSLGALSPHPPPPLLPVPAAPRRSAPPTPAASPLWTCTVPSPSFSAPPGVFTAPAQPSPSLCLPLLIYLSSAQPATPPWLYSTRG